MNQPQDSGVQSDPADDDGLSTVGTPDPATDPAAQQKDQSQSAPDPRDEALRVQRERTRAADQRAARIEAELKQLRDKDMPAVEKLTRDYTEAQERIKVLETKLNDQAVSIAFNDATTGKHSFHNNDAAMRLLDRSGITVDSEGVVTGMEEAIAKLVKENAYLLKPSDTPVEEPAAQPASAPPMNGASGATGASNGGLSRRFAALNTRRR